MEKSEIKSIIIVVLLFVVILFGTCEVKHRLSHNDPILPAFALDESWKKEKENEIDHYREKNGRLQQVRDSLWFLAAVKKQELYQTRDKSKVLQTRLIRSIIEVDSTGIRMDTVKALTDALIVNQNFSDSACDQTISLLENTVANRDTAIQIQRQVESDLKDIQKEQDLKNQYLTEQLQVSLKVQKKKTRQNKVLAGTLVFISGIVTAITLIQRSK